MLFETFGITFNMMKLYGKILNQFLFLTDPNYQRGRLWGLFDAVNYILNSKYYLVGVGQSWNAPTLDFFSLYLKGYGIVGFSSLLIYISYYLGHAPLRYSIALVATLMINGHLSTSINILLLSLCFLNYSELIVPIRDRKKFVQVL